jgi:hypothetical protein
MPLYEIPCDIKDTNVKASETLEKSLRHIYMTKNEAIGRQRGGAKTYQGHQRHSLGKNPEPSL